MDENKLYSAIEAAIIRWTLDGTRTAGSLTREIMLIIKQEQDEEIKQVFGHTWDIAALAAGRSIKNYFEGKE